METRSQKDLREERRALAANLDPAIQAGIEVSLEAATDSLADSITKAVSGSLGTTIAAAVKDSLVGTHQRLDELTSWKTDLEARVTDLQATVTAIQKNTAAQTVGESAAAHPAASLHGKAATDFAPEATHGPSGHGFIYTHRVVPFGEFTPAAHPANGTPDFTTPMTANSVSAQVFQSLGHTPPVMAFPLFTGENPKLWRTLCEQYFAMYNIHQSYWVSMAMLNFSGAASIWLQSVRNKVVLMSWEDFCNLLCTRFGRDKHQVLIRQFYTIRQTSTVAEYIERFEILVNHLTTYSMPYILCIC